MIDATIKFHNVITRQVRFGMKNIDFEFYLVEDEAGPVFRFTCVDYDLNPIDLTGMSVDFFIMPAVGGTVINQGATICTIVDAVAGVVEFQMVSPFIEEPGTYFGDLSLNNAGNVQTAPQFIRLIVRASNK